MQSPEGEFGLNREDLIRLGVDLLALEQAIPTLEKIARIQLRNAAPKADKAWQRIKEVGRQLRGE